MSARAVAALLVAAALPLCVPQAGPMGAGAVAAAKPGGGKAGTERKVRKPQRCARRGKRARACRRARLGLRVAPGVFERLVDVGRGPAPGTGGPAPGPGNPGVPRAPTVPQPLPDYVAVTATEWRLALSRAFVGAGLVTVELRNMGEDPHDLVVAPEGGGTPVGEFDEVLPGSYTAEGMTISAGRYTLFCSLPGHAEAGMTATLRVEPQP